MALKDSWNDKVNGKDIVDAEDINSIARAVIEIEERETGGITQETDPTVPAWAKQPNKPTYTADEVGADKSGTASSAVSSHNTNTSSHNDIRLLIEGLTSRLNALANSDDTTLDQMAEVVEYIKDNRELLEQVTTGKVSVTDIVDNLTTNTASKPLSAKQGVALKALIDAITVPTKLSELTNDKGYLTQHQDLSAYAKTANHYTKTESDNKYRLKSDPYTLTEADKAAITASVIESLGGNPVFGYVDANNNIIVSGNLADGSYSVKYEMENGSTVNIGSLVLDSNVYYSITKNLTNCSINNSATQAVGGNSYSATITANNGYELKSVTVTMGGQSVSVSGGVINIATVTGDIVITAVAEALPTYTNFANPSSSDWWSDSRIGSDGTRRNDSPDLEVTNAISVTVGDIIEISGFDCTAKECCVYNSSGTTLSMAYLTKQTAYFSDISATTTGGQATVKLNTVASVRFCGKPTNGVENVIIKIKRNGNYL